MDREQQYSLGALVYLKNPYGGGFRPNLTQVERVGTLKDKTIERLETEIKAKIAAQGKRTKDGESPGYSTSGEPRPAQELSTIVNEALNNRRLEKMVEKELQRSLGPASSEDLWAKVRPVLNKLRLRWEFPLEPWIEDVPVEEDGSGHRHLRITKALRIPYTPLDEQGNPLKDQAGSPLTYHIVIGFVGTH